MQKSTSAEHAAMRAIVRIQLIQLISTLRATYRHVIVLAD